MKFMLFLWVGIAVRTAGFVIEPRSTGVEKSASIHHIMYNIM